MSTTPDSTCVLAILALYGTVVGSCVRGRSRDARRGVSSLLLRVCQAWRPPFTIFRHAADDTPEGAPPSLSQPTDEQQCAPIGTTCQLHTARSARPLLTRHACMSQWMTRRSTRQRCRCRGSLRRSTSRTSCRRAKPTRPSLWPLLMARAWVPLLPRLHTTTSSSQLQRHGTAHLARTLVDHPRPRGAESDGQVLRQVHLPARRQARRV